MSQAEALLASLAEEVPEHIHSVTDSDTYFIIDPITRKLENTARKKNVIMQYDHESEVLTFELPRYVEGHDMTLCNRVYAHWNNIGTKTGREEETLEEIADLHELTDLQLNPDNPDTVICSWLIKRQSTQLVGILSFLIQYACVDDAGNMTYEWHTDFYEDMEVRKGRKNSQVAIAEYTDILEQWYARIFGTADGILAQIDNASTEAQEAIKSEGASQVQTIQQESSTQQSAIEAKGQETLDSIPPDYTEMYRMAEEAMRTKADAIVVEAEGETISVTNASDNPLQGLRIFGKTEQVKTTGKNLFNISAGLNDVLVNNEDGTYTITKVDENKRFSASIPLSIPANTPFVFSFTTIVKTCEQPIQMQIFFSDDTTTTLSTDREMSYDLEVVSARLYIAVSDTVGTYGVIKNCQIELGSSVTEYEPYSGGRPSPSPEYPQELKSIESTDVIVRGKNLIPETTLEFTRDHTFSLGYTYPAGTYVFSAIISSSDTDGDTCAVMFYKGSDWIDSVYMPRSANGERVHQRKIIKVEFDSMRFYAGKSYGTSTDDVCTITDMQLEIGDTVTEFEPYSGYILPTQRTLNSITDRYGNVYRDELVYDYPNDKWQLIQRIGRVVHGDVSCATSAHTNGMPYHVLKVNDAVDSSPISCDRYLPAVWSDQNGYAYMITDNIILVDERFTDHIVAESILQEEKPEIMYVLAEPIVHDLTTEEVLAFKALRTNKPNTVIQNGVGAYMIAEYAADTEVFMRECQPKPTDEQVQNAVTNYLTKNPVQAGATTEQAAQINSNKKAIETLQKQLESFDSLVLVDATTGNKYSLSVVNDKLTMTKITT